MTRKMKHEKPLEIRIQNLYSKFDSLLLFPLLLAPFATTATSLTAKDIQPSLTRSSIQPFVLVIIDEMQIARSTRFLDRIS